MKSAAAGLLLLTTAYSFPLVATFHILSSISFFVAFTVYLTPLLFSSFRQFAYSSGRRLQ